MRSNKKETYSKRLRVLYEKFKSVNKLGVDEMYQRQWKPVMGIRLLQKTDPYLHIKMYTK